MQKIALIQQWAKDRCLTAEGGATPDDQFKKLIEELGETAAASARGHRDEVRDGIGDIAIVMVVLCGLVGFDAGAVLNVPDGYVVDDAGTTPLAVLTVELSYLGHVEPLASFYTDAMAALSHYARSEGFTLVDCVDAAWEDIKDRTGKLINGVFVKDADLPAK